MCPWGGCCKRYCWGYSLQPINFKTSIKHSKNLTSFAMLVYHSSDNSQPAERFDNFSDQHPNCSWCQRVFAEERVGGGSQSQVISQSPHLPPYICRTQTPLTNIATSCLVSGPFSLFTETAFYLLVPDWHCWKMKQNPARRSLKRSLEGGQ